MRLSLIVLLGALFLFTCKSQTNANPETIEIVVEPKIEVLEVEAFKSAISESNIQLIDVRTPGEYAHGHIENALNIDYLNDGFATAVLKMNKNTPVYIYCRSGGRSEQAALLMKKLGFKTIYDLKGGFLAWSEQN
ncbi:MAG: rhodanese-like domain-containing protein [Flavobacteriaceae bacterium]|nr:rhodanese-like domain-containing protein [Flavobacteriaceae bacterium]